MTQIPHVYFHWKSTISRGLQHYSNEFFSFIVKPRIHSPTDDLDLVSITLDILSLDIFINQLLFKSQILLSFLLTGFKESNIKHVIPPNS